VSPAWICAVLAGGVVLSLVLFLTIRGWEEREIKERVADLVHEQVEKLEITMLRSMEVLHSIASLHAAEGRIERDQFDRFVQEALAASLNCRRFPGIPPSRRAKG